MSKISMQHNFHSHFSKFWIFVFKYIFFVFYNFGNKINQNEQVLIEIFGKERMQYVLTGWSISLEPKESNFSLEENSGRLKFKF